MLVELLFKLTAEFFDNSNNYYRIKLMQCHCSILVGKNLTMLFSRRPALNSIYLEYFFQI